MIEDRAADTDRIARISRMLREVSGLRDPAAVQHAFGAEMRHLHAFDGYVSLSRRNLPPGQYKVTGLNASHNPMQRPDPWKNWADLPVHTGGVLGRIIDTEEPRIYRHADLTDDPVLGPELGDRTTLMAAPLFDAGQALNWAIVLHRNPDAFTDETLERFFMRGNLVGRMTKGLVDQRSLEHALEQRRAELQRIAMIQQSLLPKKTPAPEGLAIATSYLTSAESGGDFFDFYEWADGHFGVIVADVSGHGAGAAVMVAMIQAILHTIPPESHTSPSEVLEYLNTHLVRKRIENSFVTAFCAKFTPDRRVMEYANAGHNRPVLRRGPAGEGAVNSVDGAASVPLGILEEPEYATGFVELEPDDTVLLYTDGIVEAFSPGNPGEREMFGLPRLRSSLSECSGAPECVVDSVHQRLFDHTGRRTRDDDQTIVAVRVTDQPRRTVSADEIARNAARHTAPNP